MSVVSHLTIQASTGRVVRLDDLRKDKAYLILHVYIEKFTKHIILKLVEGNHIRLSSGVPPRCI